MRSGSLLASCWQRQAEVCQSKPWKCNSQKIDQKEIGMKGQQWLIDNELKQRQLASTPTPAQAQAKTAAELDKVQTDALIAHQQLLTMPSPEEAAKSRWATLLKTQAETAAATASTAKTKAETALLGTNPVIAFDPGTGQRILSTMPQVQAKGFTNPVKASEGDIQKETDATKQFNDVQMNVSRYRQAILGMGNVGDEMHKTEIAHILSDKSLEAGHILNALPGLSLAAEIQNQKELAADWNRHSAVFGGVMLCYVFADATELHLFMHELFRPEINKLLQAAIRIHGEASVTEPRPGRFI